MALRLPHLQLLVSGGLAGAAVLLGALAAIQPFAALSVAGAAALIALAFRAPTANLCLLLFLTAIVPYGLQNRYDLGGGPGSPGLLLSDLVLLAGLARTSLVLLRMPLTVRDRTALAAVAAFLAVAVLQFAHGISLGRPRSDVGAELRVLLGLGGAVLLAIPVLQDPRSRDRLFRGLGVIGVLLGMWGLAQWTVDIPFAEAGDAGVREGILQTTSGRGQIQGGLFAFPVAVILAVAALASGAVRRRGMRWLLAAVVLSCGVSLLLTYERTFWVSTAAALVLVALRAHGSRRLKALFVGAASLLVIFAVLGTVAPDTLGAARERLLSLGRYQSDNSLRYRIVESRTVVAEIRRRPATGSGLAATIYWGRPWEQVPATQHRFAHNGYLWLAWKLGIPATVLLSAFLLAALLSRSPRPPAARPDDDVTAAARTGAKAALFALMLTSITFPSFTSLSASAVVGLLAALSWLPMAPCAGTHRVRSLGEGSAQSAGRAVDLLLADAGEDRQRQAASRRPLAAGKAPRRLP